MSIMESFLCLEVKPLGKVKYKDETIYICRNLSTDKIELYNSDGEGALALSSINIEDFNTYYEETIDDIV